MVGGRGEIKKDVDFPEAGEDTALCDKENKPPRIMAIAAAPGTAVLLIRLRFSTACSRPFMAIHPPFSGDG